MEEKERREKREQEERNKAKSIFDECLKLDPSLELNKDRGDWSLVKRAGKDRVDRVTASVVNRGGDIWRTGKPAIVFGATGSVVNPRNWFALETDSLVKKVEQSEAKRIKILAKKIVKVMFNTAETLKRVRNDESLKEIENAQKASDIKEALAELGVKYEESFSKGITVRLSKNVTVVVEKTYDGNYDVSTRTTLRLDKEGLQKVVGSLVGILAKHGKW